MLVAAREPFFLSYTTTTLLLACKRDDNILPEARMASFVHPSCCRSISRRVLDRLVVIYCSTIPVKGSEKAVFDAWTRRQRPISGGNVITYMDKICKRVWSQNVVDTAVLLRDDNHNGCGPLTPRVIIA